MISIADDKGFIQLGSACPGSDMMINMTLWTTQAKLSSICLGKESLGKPLVQSYSLHLSKLVNEIHSPWLPPLKQIACDKWQAKLLNFGSSQQNALSPLVSLFTENR